ncbi:hypothetical protein ElyMa_000912400 [Elysia marginata]|uniref:Uncharacterized protein n=1 Tax=Elysia marginata TaxID=1093978 RepID=A0AAV4HAS2_9GAST|nr:hypothetical protein ElyMa_000912400 [Elysia marginata]
MDYGLPLPKTVSRLNIILQAGQYTPKEIQLIFQSITARLPVRRSNTNILQISSTAYSQVPILQVGGLRNMWTNCFPKAATTCVVVGNRTRDRRITIPTRQPLSHAAPQSVWSYQVKYLWL